MAEQKKSQQVEEKKDQLPAGVVDFADAGAGLEGADSESFALPMLVILQKGSPQVDPDAGEYIEGAQPGMICDTVSGELWDGDEGVPVIPAAFKRSFIEWVPRDDGGGFVAEHDPAEGLQNTTTRDGAVDYLPNGNELKDTRTHFVLIVRGDQEDADASMIPFTSTQVKKSKKWLTDIGKLKVKNPQTGKNVNPPAFASVYRLKTVPESNDKGAWRGWKIEWEDWVRNADLYQAAKEFRDQIASGAVATEEAHAKAADTAPEGGEGDDSSDM